MEFDENAFLILAQRYKELSAASPDDPGSQDIPPKVNMKTDQLLRQFILTGGFEVDMP